jgi:hypothetical protein
MNNLSRQDKSLRFFSHFAFKSFQVKVKLGIFMFNRVMQNSKKKVITQHQIFFFQIQ